MEKKFEKIRADSDQSTNEIKNINEVIKTHQMVHETLHSKVKNLNESVYNIENIQMQATNSKLNQMITNDQMKVIKKELEEQLRDEINNSGKATEQRLASEIQNNEKKLSLVNTQVDSLEKKMSQRIESVFYNFNILIFKFFQYVLFLAG